MPLTALDKNKQQVFYNEAIKGEKYFCRFCKAKMTFKKGIIKIPHFAHFPNLQTPCHYKKETEEHVILKHFFFKEFGCKIEEKIGNNIADVIMDDVIIEIQCSPIGLEEFIKRNENAFDNNKKIVWILEKNKTFGNTQQVGKGYFLRPKTIEKRLAIVQKTLLYFNISSSVPNFFGFSLKTLKWGSGSLFSYKMTSFEKRKIPIFLKNLAWKRKYSLEEWKEMWDKHLEELINKENIEKSKIYEEELEKQGNELENERKRRRAIESFRVRKEQKDSLENKEISLKQEHYKQTNTWTSIAKRLFLSSLSQKEVERVSPPVGWIIKYVCQKCGVPAPVLYSTCTGGGKVSLSLEKENI